MRLTEYILLFFSLLVSVKNYPGLNENELRDAGKNLKQYQVGILNKIPDGPLNNQDLQIAEKDNYERNNGIKKQDEEIGIVYINENLRNKRLGKFRIQGKGIHLLFPTDQNTIKYQNFKDNEQFQDYMEKNRVEYEKNTLLKSETEYKSNPYKEIYDYEKKLLDYDIFKVNKNHHTKNLMQMAINKEQQIFEDMMNNELSEIQTKRYNKGFINPLLTYQAFQNKQENNKILQ